MDTAQSLAFRDLLTEAVKRQATDLHLSVGSYPMLRIDGGLVPLEDEAIMTAQGIQLVVDAIVPEAQKEKLEEDHDLVFTSVFDGRVRAKIHVFRQEGFLALSIRFLSLTAKTLSELKVSSHIMKCADTAEGLIIVGGANGSGRTTLAMGILEQINRSRIAHILTIENPIEYDLVSNKSIVNQREVGTDVATLSAALEHAQREDIDVLFISDLPTPESIRGALELAAAGMLVITVMNVNSSTMALEKIISCFQEHEKQHIQSLLADVLRAVIIQALLPKMGGGSVAAHELLLAVPQVKAMIASNHISQVDQLIKSSRSQGMMSFDHELADLVRGHALSMDTARRHARSEETLDLLIKA